MESNRSGSKHDFFSARVEVLLFEIALCLWIRSSFFGNFEKQNRKGSPQSLIYPLKSKLTSFMIKQFFAFSRVYQTLMRSRLSAVLLRTVHRGQYKSKHKLHLCRYMHLAFSAKLRLRRGVFLSFLSLPLLRGSAQNDVLR